MCVYIYIYNLSTQIRSHRRLRGSLAILRFRWFSFVFLCFSDVFGWCWREPRPLYLICPSLWRESDCMYVCMYACMYVCMYVCLYGIAWHLYNFHELKHSIRRLFCTTHCTACMQEFWTRNRLFTHLASSSARCRAYYLTHAFDIGDERCNVLEHEAEQLTLKLRKSGRRRTFAERPPEVLFGPITGEAVALGVCPSYRLRNVSFSRNPK